MTSPLTQGIHHLGLTVADVKEASAFFLEALNFSIVKEVPEYPAIFVTDGSVMLTLWQAKEPTTAIPFDRHSNVGLHHFALRIANETELVTIYEKLTQRDDVTIEFAPESAGGGSTQHMMCRIPGNIRLELIAV